jgi:hypothetical protein
VKPFNPVNVGVDIFSALFERRKGERFYKKTLFADKDVGR